MGREVRRVPVGWQHPTKANGEFIPLYDGAKYDRRLARWELENAKWHEGLRDDYAGRWKPIEPEYIGMSFEEWDGERPEADEYMPRWTAEETTHWMMYENVTEGTPISPVCETPEVLARWLADHNANAFAGNTTTYEHWLGMIRQGYAPTFVLNKTDGTVMSGVDAVSGGMDA